MKKKMKFNLRKFSENNGITLIALVITIIIILILAGATIMLILGDNGIILRTENTITETDVAEEKEIIKLAVMSEKVEDYKELYLDPLKEELQKNDKVDKVEECTELPNAEENSENRTYAKVTFKSGRIYYVVLKSTDNLSVGKIYEDDSDTEEEEIPEIPEGLKVGDVVTYSPSGTYSWKAKYASSDLAVEDEEGNEITTNDVFLDSSTENYKITSWKVFKKDEAKGKIELVPSTSIIGTVRLQGAQGYNNGVKLLNDACNNLYGDKSKGITARSINLTDIDVVLDSEKLATAKEAYSYVKVKYLNENNQVKTPYTSSQKYPIIYEQEDLSIITASDGTTTSIASGAGLGKSKQNSLIERTKDSGEAIGAITTAKSMQPSMTTYGMSYNDFSSALGDYSTILLPKKDKTNYWVASRSIQAYENNCYYYIRSVNKGIYTGEGVYESGGMNTTYSRTLFPVVTLKASLISGDSASGWKV